MYNNYKVINTKSKKTCELFISQVVINLNMGQSELNKGITAEKEPC